MERWTQAMRDGRFEDAWSLSQQALVLRDPATRDDPGMPYHRRWVWDGRPFSERHVLVRCYHGLGDTLQFARYLPYLAERAASVVVEVHPRLVSLLGGIAGVERIIPFDPAHPAPPSECDIEICELAFALRLDPQAALAPYLSAPPAALPRGTIGLCYAAGDWDPDRSIPPALLEPLCQGRTCITLVAEPTALPLLNPAGCPFDIGATASLIASCALVITVDTMVAHLAGALGRPTWLLLKSDPDWRWTPGACRTPWYPAMRLFHQPCSGAWEPLLRDVEQVLANSDVTQAGAIADDPPVHALRPDLVG